MSGTTSRKPDAWGETQYARATCPGAVFVAPRPRPVRAQDRHATAAIRCPRPKHAAAMFGRLGIDDDEAGRRLRPGRRHVRRAAVVDAALARASTPSRCSTAASRSGRAKAAPVSDRRAGSRTPATFDIARVTPTVDAPGVDGEPRHASALLLLDARARGALSRRDRAARSGRRPHSRRAQSAVHAEPRRRRHVQARRRSCARSSTRSSTARRTTDVVH